MLYDGGEAKEVKVRFSVLDLVLGLVGGAALWAILHSAYDAVTDREAFVCRWQVWCQLPTEADAPAEAAKETSTWAVTKRWNVTVVNLDQLDCEDAINDAPSYVDATKYLDGKCYQKPYDGKWEELSEARMKVWRDLAAEAAKDEELQAKLNSN